MYDTIKMCYNCSSDNFRAFLNVSNCLNNLCEHHKKDGKIWVTGDYGGLKVMLFNDKMIINGSICKWFLGDNLQTMGRGDMQEAIERMSDEMHLPLSRSVVNRIDVAANIILKHPVNLYLQYLGRLRYFERLEQPNGLYYINNTRTVYFYDKIKQQKKKRESIPKLFQDRNVLRYEYRLMKKIAKRFDVKHVTAEMLYNEDFYMTVLDEWEQTYNSIYKQPVIDFKIIDMESLKSLYSFALLTVLRVYGEDKILSTLNTHQKEKKIDRRTKYKIKEAFERAKQENRPLVRDSEKIDELNKSVGEYIANYR